jgi:hypothetical protein
VGITKLLPDGGCISHPAACNSSTEYLLCFRPGVGVPTRLVLGAEEFDVSFVGLGFLSMAAAPFFHVIADASDVHRSTIVGRD